MMKFNQQQIKAIKNSAKGVLPAFLVGSVAMKVGKGVVKGIKSLKERRIIPKPVRPFTKIPKPIKSVIFNRK